MEPIGLFSAPYLHRLFQTIVFPAGFHLCLSNVGLTSPLQHIKGTKLTPTTSHRPQHHESFSSTGPEKVEGEEPDYRVRNPLKQHLPVKVGLCLGKMEGFSCWMVKVLELFDQRGGETITWGRRTTSAAWWPVTFTLTGADEEECVSFQKQDRTRG